MKNKIDTVRIQKRFKEIETRLKFLRESANTDLEIFLTDHRLYSSCERDLEIAIQSCVLVQYIVLTKR